MMGGRRELVMCQVMNLAIDEAPGFVVAHRPVHSTAKEFAIGVGVKCDRAAYDKYVDW